MNAPDPAAPLLALGLNPAWQKTFFFERLRLGEVNRAREVRSQASGKGINFVAAARQAGRAATVAQFAGGATGDWLVTDLEARGLAHATVRTGATTRICNTLLCEATGTMTELIEPAEPVTATEFTRLRHAVMDRLPAAAGVALCGTFPPGVPDTFYEEAVRAARHRGIPVLLDGYRGVLPTLQAGVELLKVNAAELCALMERDDLAGAAADCLAAFPVRWLAVTAGGGQAHLFRAGEKWDFTLPKLERVLNPIGAGDTAAAVLLAQVAGRRALLEEPAGMVGAFRQALAAASASCLTPEPARFDPAAAATLATRIVVQKGR